MDRVEHDPAFRREMTEDEMERLLRHCAYGRLGLAVQNEPYVVPVSHKYHQGKIFTHGIHTGKKGDFVKRNSRVCFEVDIWEDNGWASVVCYGTLTLRQDIEARKEWTEAATGQKPTEEQIKAMEESESVIGIIQIEEMTGRCRGVEVGDRITFPVVELLD